METSKSSAPSERLSFSDKRVDVFSNVCKQNNSILNVMTSSRVVRGTKGRITLCVCAILIITGIIVCYNNTLSQLDDVRRANDQCHQQQENLSTQLQVIFDYKQRLEKSLKTEKAEHQQTKKDFGNKLDEEKLKNEKTSNEANLKLSSVQQQYNMLQTEYDDYKEESSKMQQQQLNEINDLQSKLKEIQSQLKQAISEKDNTFEHLKTQFLHLQVEKENLEKQVKATQGSHLQSESEINHLTKINHELQRELEEVKAKHFSLNNEAFQDQKQPETASIKHSPSTNFSRQVNIRDSVYQIRDSQNNPVQPRQETNVADLPSNADQHMQPDQSNIPKTEDKQLNYNQQLNNNEAFNNNENVLAAPNNGLLQEPNQKSSSTTSKTSLNNKAVSKASLDAVQPLNLPTVTPESVKNKPSQESRILNQDPHVLPLPFAHKKLPIGVVPVPKTPLEAGDESKNGVVVHKPEESEKDIREEVNNAFPNRYRANLILNELVNEDKAIEADKQEQINEVNKEGKNSVLKSDVGDKENNALEVFDPPINDKEKALEGDPFGLDDNAHGGDKVNSKQTQQKLLKQVNGLGLNGGGKLNEGHKVYDGQDGVDYEKDVQNDMQLEENDPEGEDDDPDYADHIAQHKDPAVRN